MRVLGLDPGLRHTGWGVIDVRDNRIAHIADGVIHSDGTRDLAGRLQQLHRGLAEIIAMHRPDEAAVEETFVNRNPTATLKLGMARGVVLLAPALAGIPVAEYGANHVKKAIVGAGHARKEQIQLMVRVLLPGVRVTSADAADALAVAVCHAHHRQSATRFAPALAAVGPA